MINFKKKIGNFGENKVAEHLRQDGYRILAQNYHAGGGEIDLVAAKGDGVYFVEVKTRTQVKYGLPEESVNWRKLENIKAAALAFMQENPFLMKHNFYFWLASVQTDPNFSSCQIRIIRDIFQ